MYNITYITDVQYSHSQFFIFIYHSQFLKVVYSVYSDYKIVPVLSNISL